MQSIGIKLHLCPAGTPAKKIHGATLTHHLRSPFPGFWTAYSLDDNIPASPLSGDRADCFYRVFDLGDLHHFLLPHVLNGSALQVTFPNRHSIAPNNFDYLTNNKTHRPHVNYNNVSPHPPL